MAERNSSLEKALKVLDLYQFQRRLTLTSIAQETGFSNAAISRILNSLEEMHYIYQDKIDGGYYLTDRVFALSRNTNVQNQIVNMLDEPIARLCRRLGFSVTVSVRSGNKTYEAIRKNPAKGVALIANSEEQMSLNLTAAGKVLTAFSPDPDKLIEEIDFVRLTSKSITNRSEFKSIIEEVRMQKLAYNMEEITEGLVCVAAPVLAADGIAICAISVSGYKERMVRNLYSTIARIQDTATECEKLLR